MAIADTITSMYTNVGNAYNVLTLAGADLTNVNKNLVNLTPTWKERLLYFMNNGTNEVWNNWTKVSGTGTTLSLNNTEEAPMSLTYKGNTLQNGTPTPDTPIPVQVVSGDNSIEVVGKNLLNPNEVILNGTVNVWFYKGTGLLLKANTTYTISYKGANSLLGLYIRKYGEQTSLAVAYNKKFLSYTPTEDIKVWVDFYANDIDSSISNFQLEVGSQATTYQPYQSASYPISLGVENLLNTTQNKTTFSNVTLTPVYNDDSTLKYIVLNGTANAGNNVNLGNVTFKNGETYTISGIKGYTDSTLQIFTSSSTAFPSGNRLQCYNGAITRTAQGDETCQIRLYIYSGVTYNNVKIYPMIIKGNKEQAYTPYGKTPIELCKIGTYQDKIDKSSGKNLVQMSLYNANNYVSQKLTLEAGTYYFAYTGDNASAIYIRKADGSTPINGTSVKERYNGTTIFFTTNETGEYYIQCYLGGGGFTKFTEAMLNMGTDYLPYEPYGTGWYLKKEIGKVVLNGSEAWVNLNYAYYSTVLNSLIKNIATTDQSIYVMADHFKGESVYQAGTQGTAGIYTVNTQLYLRGYNSTYADINALKTFLSSNNTIVYYVLATPTYETITDTTLLSQLEALKKSYEGQTNISQTNNDLPFELDVVALSK